MSERKTFTGRVRRRRTKRSVRAADFCARTLITVGGLGTIIAVSTVCLFLVWVVAPLFFPARLEERGSFDVPWGVERPLAMGFDEYRVLGWFLSPAGEIEVFRADNGESISREPLFTDAKLTAVSPADDRSGLVFGFEDGTLRLGTIGFATQFLEASEASDELRALAAGELAVHEQGIVQRTPQGQLRRQSLEVRVAETPLEAAPAAIRRVDQAVTRDGRVVLTCAADGHARLHSLTEAKNLLTDETTYDIGETAELPLPAGSADGVPDFALLSGRGDQVYLAWKDGKLLRFAAGDPAQPKLAEERDLTPDAQSELTKLELLLGGTTLIAGDARGAITASFLVNLNGEPAAAEGAPHPPDGKSLVTAHRLRGPEAAVTSLAMSSRSRVLAAGYADGSLRVFYVPSERVIVETSVDKDGTVSDLVMATKEDGLYACAAGRVVNYDLDPRHPEAGLAALFLPVWYEGYEKPSHVWQSSGGSEDLEPKLGLMPLVYGTLKATFYCMLFGVPIAMLAAIYTSEFLHPKAKSKIKPTIEMMASLPSVVLGFLAALVFAPFVKDAVPAILSGIITVPFALLVGAYLWQILPYQLAARLVRFRFAVVCAVLPIGVAAAVYLGPHVERWLFAGDMLRWLSGQVGTGTGAWMILLLPLSSLGAGLAMSRYVTPWLVRRSGHLSRGLFAAADFAKFFLGAVCTLAISLGVSWLLTQAGFDPRGSYVDTYDQRNALIVGFVMGFAVVPLIYTLADDALSSVPEQLRAASLGAGATPWQTAVRIVIPTAMSGLFSAVMVGLGRAVGETMIVLMAGGNIPVMDPNMFSGFRTLSANIAVELAEAVRNSTHYRTLFLAALTLFLLTFLVNTVAEMVRIRFRRRVYQM